MLIYCITNKLNNKKYIGQTIRSLKTRFWGHIHEKANTYIHRTINKYGRNNFIIQELDTASSIKELNEKEIHWIKKLNTLSPKGYNIDSGGKQRGQCSKATKEKISKANKGKISPTKGKHMSLAFCKNVSKGKTGVLFSNIHKNNISNSMLGKNKGKSSWNKGGKQSEDWIEKRSIKLQGRKHSEETKEKMRLKKLEYFKTHTIWNKKNPKE